MSQSCLTLNIKPQYVLDWGKTLDFCRKLDPVAIVASIDSMNAANRVNELAAALPNAEILGRYIFSQDGGMHLKPQAEGDTRQWIVSPNDALNAWGSMGINIDGTTRRKLYLINEPQATKAAADDIARLVQWTLEAIALATTRGISLCILNFGVGHPALLSYGEYDARFDDVLTAISKQRDMHALGMHVYSPADSFGRLDGMIARCHTLGITSPRVHITEYGFDAGSGGDPLNGYKSRGYSGSQFAAWEADKIKNVYNAYFSDDVLQSVATFVWGGGADWKNFDVEPDLDWQTTIIAAKDKGDLTIEKKPVTKPFLTPMPQPSDVSDAIRIRVTNVLGINLRSGASTDYQQAGMLHKGDEVTLYRTPFKQDASKQVWRWVDVSPTLGGWVCADVLTFEPVTPPVIVTPPPVITPPVSAYSRLYAAQLKVAQAQFELAQLYKQLDEETKMDRAA